MKLSEFEHQSLSGLKEAVKQVYKKASANNQKLVIGDYKGNPRLINASDFFAATTSEMFSNFDGIKNAKKYLKTKQTKVRQGVGGRIASWVSSKI